MPSSKPFSVRIVSIDYYMTPPIHGFDISYSSFHGGNVKEVPVIRIYGSTPAGQKACVHIHRVLPYLYVPCSDLGCTNDDQAGSCLHAISLALEKALKLKANTGSKRQHVHSCSLVRAKKFYGYHSSEELFVKIYFYYPQDVSRASNLLLEGAVIDRVVQPYESHIPFLLQFLIDYNLYGMGHLHVSKMKFRYPVPAVFSPRKAKYSDNSEPQTNYSTCMAGDPQSGRNGDTCSDFPLWISSSIPDGWVWPSSEQQDSSENKGTSLYRRQSTSDLEADALVDEIMNQRFISYAPLSQTHSEVKMVQSLVPIWEEEFERTGLVDAMPSDSGKPGPLEVLRILSDRIEFEKFMEVNNDGDDLFIPKSLEITPPANLLHGGLDNIEHSNHLPSKYVNESDGVGSLLSSSASQNVDATNGLQVPNSEVPSSAKASDQDALRLLKWLASSQAAEDINSDDDLAPQTILSPLLPAKTIEKVLEKASLDYESESQQECQDILDSIDILNLEELNGRVSNPEKYNRFIEGSSSNVIPQLDGSSDDPASTPVADKSFKSDKSETIPSRKIHSCPDQDSSSTCKHRRKRPQMGSLPVFTKKLSNVSPCDMPSSSDGHENDKRGNFGTALFWSKAERYSHTSEFDEEKDINAEQVNTIVECSTRDLMRRKRSHRIDQCDHASLVKGQKTESCFDVKCHKEGRNIENEETECHQRNTSSILEPTIETSLVKNTSSSFHNSGYLPLSSTNDGIVLGTMPNAGIQVSVLPLYHGDVHPSKNHSFVNFDSTLQVSSQIPECSHFSENVNDGEDFSCKDLLHEKSGNSYLITSNLDDTSKNDCSGESQCQVSNYTCKGADGSSEHCNNSKNEPTLLQVCNSASENITKAHESLKLIGMTFSEKPPLIEWTDDLNDEAPLLPVDMDTGVRKSCQEGYSDVCLPFFTRNFQEEKERPEFIPEEREIVNNHESLKGIPTVYQNDGSRLFMLTPTTSPPSRECVTKWLSCDTSDALEQQMDIELPFHHILNENAADNLDSQNSQSNDNNQSPHHKREIDTPHGTKEKPLANYSQDVSQISGPEPKTRQTPLSQIGFRDPASIGGGQQLTLLSIEVQSESRGDLRPDPRFDAINFIVLIFQEDDKSRVDAHVLLRRDSACARKNLDAVSECEVLTFTEELDLFNHFIKVIRTTDPDVLMGWDVQSGSLGYLAERAGHLALGLLNKISRTPSETNVASGDSMASQKDMGIENPPNSVTSEVLQNAVIEDEWGRTHASGVHVGGRIVLNVWRLMRNEVKLNMYTAEAVAEAVLRRKIPCIHWKVVSKWFTSGPTRARYRAIEYVLERAKLNLQIMSQLDMINRTSELARVFGIDFFSVLSRGSQYRVESMFLRLAHTQNYLAISPGSQQVASQPAMECLPLVMEPESNFYADPVIVLDFQSLYPSMVIAYNLCFSTCLGKITCPDILGVSSYSPDINILRNLKNELLFTPNGVAYVPSNVRKGILPRLLEEILSTRIMVKQAMKKLAASQQVLRRILNARQLALKLIANVTYGYTAAGFSGRMPCAELADSIMQCGRRTLETAISFVNLNDKWKARVIYGDTDSMFVLLKGRTVKEAFAIGREIASAISNMNPAPVTLKMEKVYYPCFLLTKKRYVGYSFESPDQMKPVFDAKGIETVRRDTCPAVSKTLEKTLSIYFECQDIVKVKAYLVRQWTKILSGRVSLQDFVFAKEVRLGTYSSRASSLPPAAIVATKAMQADPRAEPRYAERVPYVVVHGEPGARLVDMVVNPLDLLALGSPFRLNDTYYIRKQIIPALQRVFGLVRADLNQWFLEMPRPGRKSVEISPSLVLNPQKTRIDYYYLSKHCIMCGELVQSSAHLCHECLKNEGVVAVSLTQRTSKLEKEIHHLAAICRHCGGGDWLLESGVKCISLACSVFYERRKVQKELQSLTEATARTGFYPKCMVEWF